VKIFGDEQPEPEPGMSGWGFRTEAASEPRR
jgi:hypothetical protein